MAKSNNNAKMAAIMDQQPRRVEEGFYASSSSSGFYTDDSLASMRRSTRKPKTINVPVPHALFGAGDDLPKFPTGMCANEAAPYREGSDSDRHDAARICHAFNIPEDHQQDESDSQDRPKKRRKTSPFFGQGPVPVHTAMSEDMEGNDDEPPIIDIFDEEDRFKKIVQYRPMQSKNVKKMCGETLYPDPVEKQRIEAMVDSVRPVAGAGAAALGRTSIPPLFTTLENRAHEHHIVGKNKCYLCAISESNVPDFIADRQSSATRDVRYSAYAQMTFNDLKRCGIAEEPQLMQENADIFNQEIARLAAAGKPNCHPVTVAEMNKHLDDHDHTNPKRPVLKAMLKAKYLVDRHFAAIEGVTTDGTNAQVLRQAYTRLYFTAQKEYLSCCNRFAAVCSYVNIYMLGETPLTGKPLHALMGGTGKAAASGGNDSRHMALKKLTGSKAHGFLQ
jgi:hypothetical protein